MKKVIVILTLLLESTYSAVASQAMLAKESFGDHSLVCLAAKVASDRGLGLAGLPKSLRKVVSLMKEPQAFLRYAIRKNDPAMVRFAVAHLKADTKSGTKMGGCSALFYAVRKGSAEAVQALIELGEDPQASLLSKTLLHYALEGDDTDVVRVLLDAGSDPDMEADGGSVLGIPRGKSKEDKLLKELMTHARIEDLKKLVFYEPSPLDTKLEGMNGEYIRQYLLSFEELHERASVPRVYAEMLGREESLELMIRSLIALRGPNYRNASGETTLHLAVSHSQDLGQIRSLLACGAQVDAKDNTGVTPLHLALMRGASDKAHLLLQADASRTIRTSGGMSNLHAAAHGGDLRMVNSFLREIAFNDRTAFGITPLDTAIQGRSWKVVEQLLKLEYDLFDAAEQDDWERVQRCLEGTTCTQELLKSVRLKDKDLLKKQLPLYGVGNNNDTVGRLAVFFNESAISSLCPPDQTPREWTARFIKDLRDHGAQLDAVDMMGNCPIHIAACGGSTLFLQGLLDVGIDIESAGSDGSPLHDACRYGQLDTARLLIDQGADLYSLTPDGLSPLHCLATQPLYGPIPEVDRTGDLIDLLLSKGVSIDCKTREGKTALWMAAEIPTQNKKVALLLARGAHYGSHGPLLQGKTPLHCAVSEEAVRALLHAGASLEAQDDTGRTPLHRAVMRGNVGVVEALLEAGALVNARSHEDRTPFHEAARNLQNADIIDLLIEYKADRMARTKAGRTALHEAALSNAGVAGFKSLKKLCALYSKEEKAAVDANGKRACDLCEAEDAVNWVYSVHLRPGYDGAAAPQSVGVSARKKLLYDMLSTPEFWGYVWSSSVSLWWWWQEVVARRKSQGRALIFAARYNETEKAQKLLDEGANPHFSDDSGKTPLHYAAEYGHEAMVVLLVDRGAPIDAQDDLKRTPLHYAVLNKHLEIVRLILLRNASPHLVDYQGLSPAMMLYSLLPKPIFEAYRQAYFSTGSVR